MDGTSLDIADDLLAKLKTLIPQAFTEGKIDVQKIQTLLGEVVNINNERYQLSWAGKSEAYKVLQMPTTATLIPQPEQSVNWDESENIFIEGENLEVLKVLQKSYYGKIKMIYIDPPYNTGSDSFIYPDKFSETKEEYLKRIGEKDEEGYMMKEGLFRKNSKENGQFHSNWLNMMLPRLFLARNLLKDDGVIFVSINDIELSNLRELMDEIFGEDNFLANLVWANKEGGGSSDSKNFRIKHEYILCYAKNIQYAEIKGIDISNRERYTQSDEFVNERGQYYLQKLGMGSIQYSKSLDYPIEVPDGSTVMPKDNNNGKKACWRWSEEKFHWGIENKFIEFKKDKNEQWIVYSKQYLNCDNEGNLIERSQRPLGIIDNYSSTQASKFLDSIGLANYFDYTKPSDLIKYLISLISTEEQIILDFFAGSGTTGQSVIELNEEDRGSRKYILVQLPEMIDEKKEAYNAGFRNISEIAISRLTKVIEKIQQDNDGKLALEKPQKLGFRKYTLSPSNFKIWRGDVVETEAELTKQMELFVTPQRANAQTENILWELLIKNGVSLTEKIQQVEVGEGGSIYHTSDKRFAFVLDKYTPEVQRKVLALKPRTVICLDSLFQNQDMVKTNAQLKFEDNDITFKTV